MELGIASFSADLCHPGRHFRVTATSDTSQISKRDREQGRMSSQPRTVYSSLLGPRRPLTLGSQRSFISYDFNAALRI